MVALHILFSVMQLKRMIYQVTVFLTVAMLLCAPASALSARNAIVMDAATGNILFEKDADTRCLIASTTKIMTGLLICEDCDLSRQVEIPAEAQGIEGSSLYLKAGEQMTIEALLYGLMLSSGNDAAVALAIAHSGSIAAFVEQMNRRAAALGLESTHYANPNGLDDEGNFSTCRDLAKLGAYAMENPDFARVVSTRTYQYGSRTMTNHNKLLRYCDGAEGIKTGFTKAAGRILVSSIQRHGRRLVLVTMYAPDDWNDHCTLAEQCFSKFNICTLCKEGDIFGNGLCAAENLDAALLPEETVDAVRIRMDRNGGTAEFYVGASRIGQCSLKPMEAEQYADTKNHSIPGSVLAQEGRGADPCRARAAER